MRVITQAALVYGSALAILVSGCSSWQARNEEEPLPQKEANVTVPHSPPHSAKDRVAVEMDRNVISSIRFTPGREVLTPEAASVIERALEEARIRGAVDLVEVVAWPDAEYPAKGTELPKRQVRLAEHRGQNIEKYVRNVQPSATVRIHNMAQHSSNLGELFNTNDAELKKKLVSLGVAPTSDEPSVVGRSSTALVFIKVK
jgi:hypothetical protein